MEEIAAYLTKDKSVEQGIKIVLDKADLLPETMSFIDDEEIVINTVHVLLHPPKENENDYERVTLHVELKCYDKQFNWNPHFIVTSINFEERLLSLMSNGGSIIWFLKEDTVQMIKQKFNLSFRSKAEIQKFIEE